MAQKLGAHLVQRPGTDAASRRPALLFPHGRASPACHSTATRTTTATAETIAKAPLIQIPVSAKEPAPPPEAVPVVYSTTYIRESRKPAAAPQQPQEASASGAQQLPVQAVAVRRRQELDDDENAGQENIIMSALKQVDRSLDELEQNPLPLQKEIYEFSRGPVGTATTTAVAAAAKVTLDVTKEAVKAALPIGQWMMKEGAKAAFSLMTKAVAESAKQKQQPSQKTGTVKQKVGKAKRK